MMSIESCSRFLIRSYLEDNPGADVVMLSVGTDLSDDDLRHALTSLVQEKIIKMDDEGRFYPQ